MSSTKHTSARTHSVQATKWSEWMSQWSFSPLVVGLTADQWSEETTLRIVFKLLPSKRDSCERSWSSSWETHFLPCHELQICYHSSCSAVSTAHLFQCLPGNFNHVSGWLNVQICPYWSPCLYEKYYLPRLRLSKVQNIYTSAIPPQL